MCILIGVKEVPKSLLISSKIYYFFLIHSASYNRSLLKNGTTTTDGCYELLKDSNNKRLLGFKVWD